MRRVREFANDILTAARQVRATATFVVATGITALVCIPLSVRAFDARNDKPEPAAEAAGITVLSVAGEGLLDGATVQGDAFVSVEADGLAAIAFRLIDAEGELVLEGIDRFGPGFDLLTDDADQARPLDTTELADGSYTLLATLTFDDEGVGRRQAGFAIAND